MFTIPLYSFLFIYAGFLLIFLIFSLINVFHITGTGTLTLTSFFVTFIVSALTVLIFYATWYFLQGTDWQTPVTVWNSSWISTAIPF